MMTLGNSLSTSGSLATSSSFSVFDAGRAVFQRLGAQVLDVPLVGQFLAAGAEAEQQIALILGGVYHVHLVGQLFVEQNFAARVGQVLGHRLAVLLADMRGPSGSFCRCACNRTVPFCMSLSGTGSVCSVMNSKSAEVERKLAAATSSWLSTWLRSFCAARAAGTGRRKSAMDAANASLI